MFSLSLLSNLFYGLARMPFLSRNCSCLSSILGRFGSRWGIGFGCAGIRCFLWMSVGRFTGVWNIIVFRVTGFFGIILLVIIVRVLLGSLLLLSYSIVTLSNQALSQAASQSPQNLPSQASTYKSSVMDYSAL